MLDCPQAAPARNQLAAGLRVTFEGAYAIYYTHDDRELVVIRVCTRRATPPPWPSAAALNDHARRHHLAPAKTLLR